MPIRLPTMESDLFVLDKAAREQTTVNLRHALVITHGIKHATDFARNYAMQVSNLNRIKVVILYLDVPHSTNWNQHLYLFP